MNKEFLENVSMCEKTILFWKNRFNLICERLDGSSTKEEYQKISKETRRDIDICSQKMVNENKIIAQIEKKYS